ncbi:HD domain-containing protein [Micromonospora inaquosa]|uniref:HD domain-containing protein n=1 Tax=Micromonospora inaquosa TaxID=2203716 RepID=UPI001FC9D763|nr:HD domain-containing protein [Micromonospora inaquosa]
MSDLTVNAAELAAELLDSPPLARRWAHVQGVGQRATELAVTVAPGDRDLLVAAAWLHDIGYAPDVVDTGLHSLDGARYLRRHGYPPRLVALVAHHTCARIEAAERGLAEQLAPFPFEEGPLMDALVTADLTVGPRGQRIEVAERIEEILQRYPPQSPVHRAIQQAKPLLIAHTRRTLERLDVGV